MTSQHLRDRRTGWHERGASLVEFALISPLLFMLLFGTLTGGLTLSRQNSVENAVREGTRFGAIFPSSDPDYLEKVYDQVARAATGDLDPGVPGRDICVAFIDGDDAWVSKTGEGASDTDSGDWDSGDPLDDVACFDDGRFGLGEPRVQVRAARASDISAILYDQTVTLSSQSVTRYER
jgi:hypothetical protein